MLDKMRICALSLIISRYFMEVKAMKKAGVILLSLMLLAFAGCPNNMDTKDDGKKGEGDKKEDGKDTEIDIEDTKVIDPLLVGDYWFEHGEGTYNSKYNLDMKGNGIVYNFTSTVLNESDYSQVTDDRKFTAETTIKAYSTNGKLYAYEDNALIFSYTIWSLDYIKATLSSNYYLMGFTDADKNVIMSIITPENDELFFIRLPASFFEK